MQLFVDSFARSLAITATLLIAAPPAGAQATKSEARRLEGVAARYFGLPPRGEKRSLVVTPEGDHYSVRLDLDRSWRDLTGNSRARKPSENFELELGVLTMTLTPRGDGLWRVAIDALPKIGFRRGEEMAEMAPTAIDMSATVDANHATVSDLRWKTAKWTWKQVERQANGVRKTTDTDVEGETGEGVARPGVLAGTIDMETSDEIRRYTETIELRDGKAAGIPDLTVRMTAHEGAASRFELRGLRFDKLMDLWAAAVAAKSATVATGAASRRQVDRLYDPIVDAMPFFDHLVLRSKRRKFEFFTAFGIFSAAELATELSLTGLVHSGEIHVGATADEIDLRLPMMPAWAFDLAPKQAAMRLGVSGFDLASAVTYSLGHQRTTDDDRAKREENDRLTALALPKGHLVIDLRETRLAGPDYEFTLAGSMRVRTGEMKATYTLTGRGVDAIRRRLARATHDPTAAHLSERVTHYMEIAERNGDDLVWRLDVDGTAVSINGRPMTPPHDPPPAAPATPATPSTNP
jgi:hypothetical protein